MATKKRITVTTANFQQLSPLSDLAQEWRVRSEERARATHSNFNVFTTVLAAHDEVRLHNRFIHNLLNPEGTHDCGDLFLKLFFETLEEVPDGLDNYSYQVRKEASTAQGQIDLLLESPEMGVAIENKIYAGEQHRQLARYAEYLRMNHRENNLLIYLTLDGKEAGSHEGADYLRISYREHILAWLDKCLAATFSIIPINQVLIQYRHVVRSLTGRTLEHQAMNDIADHLIANPNLILMQADYNAGVEEVKARALDILAESLIEELPPEYPGALRGGMTHNRFGCDVWGSIRISPASGPFQNTPYQIVIERSEKWNAIFIGIESRWNTRPLTETESATLTHLNQLLDNEYNESGFAKVSPRETWNGEYWPVGSHDLKTEWQLTSEDIIELLDSNKRHELTEDLVSRSLIYIKLLEKLHLEASNSISNPEEQ